MTMLRKCLWYTSVISQVVTTASEEGEESPSHGDLAMEVDWLYRVLVKTLA